MKKKVLAVALTVLLLGTVVGTTLAWFTDTDQVTNTFTIGSVEIEQSEMGVGSGSFVQNQALMPIINTEEPWNDKNYVTKRVSVHNKGRNEAYVRTSIAVPAALADYIMLHVETGSNGWVEETGDPYPRTTEVNGEAYVVRSFIYTKKLAVQDANSTQDSTTELLKGVYMCPEADLKDNPATVSSYNLELCKPDPTQEGGYSFSGVELTDSSGHMLQDVKIKVLVATQGVQAEGFADAEEALSKAFNYELPAFQG